MHDKSHRKGNWLQAERELINAPDFEQRVNHHVDKAMKYIPHKWKVKRDKIFKMKKLEYIKRRAYYIWKNSEFDEKNDRK